MDEFLWRIVCCCMGIKDFLSEQASLCEYIWEVNTYMVITGEGHSGPDIWPKTLNQVTITKDIILIIWYKKAIKQMKINP